MKEKLTNLKCFLYALSAGVLISGCSMKEDYTIPEVKVEPIPKEETIEKLIEEKPEIKIQEITISAVGDCTLGTDTDFGAGNFKDVFNQVNGDYSYFFKNVYPILSEDDLSIANLEGPLTEVEEEFRVDKTFNFKGDNEYTNILTEGSIEAVNLANNHSFDYGNLGYEDTKKNLNDANIPFFGYDNYCIYDVNGIKVGLAGITGWTEEEAKVNTQNAMDYFQENQVDLKIISYHWGIEREPKQNATQENIARFAIDNGADLILGHHPHVLQGIEVYKGKYIVYSLGNFVFGGNRNPSDKDTMIFQQTFHFENEELTNTTINIIPCSLSGQTNKNDYQPRILEGEEREQVLKRVLQSSVNFEENEN